MCGEVLHCKHISFVHRPFLLNISGSILYSLMDGFLLIFLYFVIFCHICVCVCAHIQPKRLKSEDDQKYLCSSVLLQGLSNVYSVISFISGHPTIMPSIFLYSSKRISALKIYEVVPAPAVSFSFLIPEGVGDLLFFSFLGVIWVIGIVIFSGSSCCGQRLFLTLTVKTTIEAGSGDKWTAKTDNGRVTDI